MSRRLLRELAALRLEVGPRAAARRVELIERLARRALPTAAALAELHELLLFACAYADGPAVRDAAERALAAFARRRDLARFREALADSGIAGTAIRYPFFYPTAGWLARRHPRQLSLDREALDEAALRALLLQVLSLEETVWLREGQPRVASALARLAGRRGNAVWLLERLAAMPGDEFTREALHDGVGPPYLLRAGAGTPNRTLARAAGATVAFRTAPPARGRPDLAAELGRPPLGVAEVRGAAAVRLVELAREAMVTRARDLDCFCYGDARDVRRVIHSDGLEFAAIGSRPSRRLLAATAYGLLTLRNGVPIGYAQLDAFLGTALVHFNTFATFRGADAGWVFARLLATARTLFGCEAFAIEPYQLGQGNDEALDSGAWWFYRKLGFAPRAATIARLAAREERRLSRRPRAFSSRATLARLAADHLFWEPLGRAATVPPHPALSRAIGEAIAQRSGPPERARAALAGEAAELCGLAGQRLGADERLWQRRWAPLLLALPGVEAWSRPERHALGDLVRAKAGRREADLLEPARAHPRFGPALLALAERLAR